MPFFQTPHTTLYYDLFEPDVTIPPPLISPVAPRFILGDSTVLLLHGFAGTPASDFAGQLPSLRTHYRVLAPHLHGYGSSSQRTSYSVTYYRQDVADMLAL